ncbi:hypothetical protein L198_02170 [Cryptococcus wingfieldii CBS 7118]|uniref:SUN domain-containing protein n=1 Tax=Cryptococcus wingfieldii CBS 7118 TaxID=1295528 RepID=A0A1E3JR51_9TREE|nr:hypothetical protein L198_02170 [Cryptococcus wingfieldii CBS 7118]ODO03325.1 hypothetical protein L198_02170 [Cryptococcus wingfieldii CBS 7118]
MPPRKAAPPPSPARSARSARSNTHDRTNDDEWDRESITSGAFKVPSSRGKTSNGGGFKDTSVNIATAFHAAQTGHLPPPSKSNLSLTSNGSSSRSLQVPRAISPAESLAQSARALSPVRFFLRPTDEDGEEFSSFSSADNTSANKSINTSGEGESYDYYQEEEFVRRAQQQQKAARGKTGPADRKRRGKAAAEDMPYRPAEEDAVSLASDDSGGAGEGIVRSGALDGRAGTRGKRAERGEGYLGMGLGLQPKRRGKGRRSGGAEGETDDDGTPGPTARGWTPALELEVPRRSPTPAQLLRALSPRLDRRSPGPSMGYQPRRQPSDLRTILTNLLHGVALGLQFVVEIVSTILDRIMLRPISAVFGTSRDFTRLARDNWWKWAGLLLGLSLAIRLFDGAWRSRGIYTAPDAPPSNIDEMSNRLTSLEQATAVLSDMLRAISEGDQDLQQSAVAIKSRVTDVEDSIVAERKRIEGVKGDLKHQKTAITSEIDKLRTEIHTITTQSAKHEKLLSASDKSAKTIESLEREIAQLKTRVGTVEQSVHVALEDGRLVAAIEKVLPHWMPVWTDAKGQVQVEPAFWAEMKKVMVGKGEVETIARKLITDSIASDGGVPEMPAFDQRKVEEWMDKAFDRRSADSFMDRQTFTQMLDEKLRELARHVPASPSKQSVPSSTVTIKSSKGEDLTSLFTSLIDTALLRYSKDTLARTDYALFTAGARVIPHLTSDTLTLRTASGLGKWALGRKDVQGRPPATALHPDISVGSCWPFQGEAGSLGVMLVDRVVVGDVTIEHAPKELAIDVATAPKSVKVMGLVDTEENREKLASYWAENPTKDPTDVDYLPLGTFTYDPSAYSHIQTFPVPPDVVNLGIPVGVVIFKVESNWGGDLTCLYRVRVHAAKDDFA